jgi:predicted amidohydrolase YtcJ
MSDVAGLITKISTRRQELDQTFFNELREMRHAYGDRAVDQALATLQQQRDQVAVTK